ncbi:hypothetical protein ACFVWN_20400 [Nocardiopsis flavescens]|uniref:hypothetical protein n=1 Tax=Nocardiopsis flavescens TaxID=758803 RepID=UPI003660AA91
MSSAGAASPDIEARAAAVRARFVGFNLRIGRGGRVHRVELFAWIGGVLIPAPACHVGFALDPGRLEPDAGPVTCRRCRDKGDTATTTYAQLEIDMGEWAT